MTNSGKTYTVFGDDGRAETQGLLPRMLAGVLAAARGLAGAHVEMGMAEVYNESVYDLLAHHDSRRPRPGLPLVEDSSGRTSVAVKGLVLQRVATAAEGRRLVAKGCRHRQVGHTRANSDSSRSHAVVLVRVMRAAPLPPASGDAEAGPGAGEQGPRASMSVVGACRGHGGDATTGEAKASEAKTGTGAGAGAEGGRCEVFAELMVVDMAGSERTSRTNAVGARLQEAASINTSLLAFSRCVHALLQQQHTPGAAVLPPFRESKLTRLVQDAFIDPHASTTLVVNASPSAGDWKETANSLHFGALAQELVRDEAALLAGSSKRRRAAAAGAGTVAALQEQLRAAHEHAAHARADWAQREAALHARIAALERDNRELRDELDWSRRYFQSFIEKLGNERSAEFLIPSMPPRPPGTTHPDSRPPSPPPDSDSSEGGSSPAGEPDHEEEHEEEEAEEVEEQDSGSLEDDSPEDSSAEEGGSDAA